MARARRMQEIKISIDMSGATHYVLLHCSPAASFMRPGPYGSKIHVQGALILYLANHLSTGDMWKTRDTWREIRAPRTCIELHRARALTEEQCFSAAIAAAMAPRRVSNLTSKQKRGRGGLRTKWFCWCTINFTETIWNGRKLYII